MNAFVAYNSKWRIGLLIIVAIGFVTTGLWMIGAFGIVPRSERLGPAGTVFWGWASIVFFGPGALLLLRRLFDETEQVRIDASGIRWAKWSGELIPWSEITEVSTWSYKRQNCIVLHLREPSRFPGSGLAQALRSINKQLTGGDIAISMTGTDRSFKDAMAAIAQFRPAPRPL